MGRKGDEINMTTWKDVHHDAELLLLPDEDLTVIGIEQREILIKEIDELACALIDYRMKYGFRNARDVCPI